MADDMHSMSLVQDIGAAVLEPPFIKYRANARLHARNLEDLLACARAFISKLGLSPAVSMNDLEDYFRAMAYNSAFGIHGTTPGNGTIRLFLLARQLQPKIIVESGVFFGSSLFTLRQAAPEPKLFAFDIDLSKLQKRLAGVDYRQHDWRLDEVRAESPSDFCFFRSHQQLSAHSPKLRAGLSPCDRR
jgi:hypothetical protein